ncbi:hypothetical protein GNY06_10090 [Elizabethkingia argentiflava]|uniref:Major facilitator superfamily (MFS) profile domain-containing protein n=1 Tax=Elizabethkingia argenteiflava TaxID=2681556 RepID=A0A845PZB5_9FLAO|nr:multidrug effflux MFS transporter [Elizabethkingia argenteiflava]NAW51708.1 hypothetical protein [Elizabethkingia argenteiflava]
MVIGYLLGNVLNGKLIVKIKDHSIFMIAHFIIILSCITLYFSYENKLLFLTNSFLLIFNLGIGLILPKYMSEISNKFSNNRGSASAISGFMQCIIAAVFVSFIGFYKLNNLIFVIIFILTLLSAIILLILPRKSDL